MRRNGGLWMVTLANREPKPYDELPVYFKTRAGARDWRDWRASEDNADEIVVLPAPDDVRAADVDWEWGKA